MKTTREATHVDEKVSNETKISPTINTPKK
jgi:hypothetical protein